MVGIPVLGSSHMLTLLSFKRWNLHIPCTICFAEIPWLSFPSIVDNLWASMHLSHDLPVWPSLLLSTAPWTVYIYGTAVHVGIEKEEGRKLTTSTGHGRDIFEDLSSRFQMEREAIHTVWSFSSINYQTTVKLWPQVRLADWKVKSGRSLQCLRSRKFVTSE